MVNPIVSIFFLAAFLLVRQYLILCYPISNRNLKGVDFDVDLFMKDMESFVRRQGNEDTGRDVDIGEGSSSDMEFGECFI